MRILTDVDGVLLDWFKGFRAYVEKRKLPTSTFDPTDWHLTDWLKEHDLLKTIEEFNTSTDFEFLNPFSDSLRVLPALHARGHEIVAISSCSNNALAHAMRAANLHREYGFLFKGIICLPLGVSKYDVLKQYPRSWWIEDKPENALDGYTAGHKAILLTQPYNSKHVNPLLIRCDSWHDIHEVIRAHGPS